MLLAVAAYNVVPTFESRQLMGQLLGEQPALKRYLAAAVTSITFDASGRYAATSNQSGSVTVWDLARGIATGAPLQGNEEEIAYVCFAGGRSEQVAAVTVKNNLITWEQGKRSGVTLIGDTDLTAVHCANGAPELLGVDVNGRILAWDLARPNVAGDERGRLPVGSISFTRSGAQVASVDDHSITIFDLKTSSTRSTEFNDSRLKVTNSQISDDGSLVATVDSTSTLRVWKTETGKPANPLPLQLPGLVISLQFSPNSQSLALALNDGSVLMVANTWMQFGPRMRGSSTDDKVLPVEFSPNGEVLLSGFSSGKVIEWLPTLPASPAGRINTVHARAQALRAFPWAEGFGWGVRATTARWSRFPFHLHRLETS
jgi:WD40 repeat protein